MGLEKKIRGVAEGTGVVQPGEKEAEGRPCREASVGVFSQVTSSNAEGNSTKLCQRMFRLGSRNTFFIKKVVNPWKRLPRVAVESPFLVVFKNPMGGVLRDMS